MFIYFTALTCLMVLVVYFDITRYIIPNWLNGLIAVLYAAMVLTSPVPIEWKHALIGAGIVFVIGYVIFTLKWMGGGDIKLFTVLALWVGFTMLPDFVMVVAILGGVLSVALLALRRAVPQFAPGRDPATLPRILRDKEPVPYGIAISVGFIFFLWQGKVPGLSALAL